MMAMRTARALWAAVTLLCVTVCAASAADKWEIMKFTENVSADMGRFYEYCDMNDISPEDVLWANNCTEIEPGTELMMPQTRADLLAIWQKAGSWQRKGLHDKEAFRASRDTLDLPPLKSGGIAAEAIQSAAQPVLTPAPRQDAEGTAPLPSLPPAPTGRAPLPALEPLPTVRPRTQPAEPIALPSPAPVMTAQEPSVMPAPSAPDISVKKPDDEPIIIMKPEGDRLSGPMRLIISGDEVEVVKLPADTKQKPSHEELNKLLPVPFLTQEELHDRSGDLKGAKMIWPVDGIISSPFGQRGNRHHDGLDIPMPPAAPIKAARAGTVEVTGTNTTPGFRGYGNFALINHGNNVKTLYAHCQKVNVKAGQRVRQGQIIALVGRSGRASTDHLHFEVRVGGKAMDPMKYLPKRK